MNYNYFFILDGESDSVIITPAKGDTAQTAAQNTNAGTSDPAGSTDTTAAAPPASGSMGIWSIVFYLVLIAGVFYFLIMRPQRKRDKKMKEMQSNIRTGDSVLLSSGMYGKIVDVGEDVYVVELGVNRGIRVPINKTDVLAVKEPKFTPSKHGGGDLKIESKADKADKAETADEDK